METAKPACTDPVIWNQWHVISALDEVPAGVVSETLLLDERISFTTSPDGEYRVWRSSSRLPAGAEIDGPASLNGLDALPVKPEYGYLWTSLGEPPDDLFPLPEYHHPKRRNMNAGSVGVATSAPRAVENFLDLAHFPYVHEGSLGVLPHTEVAEYDVEVRDGEVHATKCDMMVPKVGVNFDEPLVMRYRYRVPHPYCVMLYYDSLPDPSLEDICAIWVQPMTADRVRAHNYMGVIDDTSTNTDIKGYQLLIFAQDKPILENQHPKRLPLDPRAETPIRADRSAIAYRRWLSDLGVTYGVIPAGR
ncbi:MAG: aromatic ring-hydroxylating dioxygenase subunit alpha [Acidimicrobiaceae bacterium]|nr:aromatic ring-hydroxylating dioxygenase subunit alpha [Acidimicrobiaceae bacterium]MYB86349.1 aromatic ring-hydroxylating dioxygenase subunit alpha [Acidimicrobiaceae bacterium]MYH94458.1 aromatic ring-hydroxylating dioxygenase subunit alpha [Acidimicrobiaceae bacterium]